MIALGQTLTDEHGVRYVVNGSFPVGSPLMPPDARGYALVRIPDGMTAADLGRRFRPAPTMADPTAFDLLVPQ